MTLARLTSLLFVLELLPISSLAYTWTFGSAPSQCQNLTISISGGGKPPYSVLIIPSGPSPFTNGTEIRKIMSQNFSSNSVTFQLPYPANSQLIAVVSDATGFGSGGTSADAEVTSSSDSSCIDASQPVTPDWFLQLNPSGQVVQCAPEEIFWKTSTVQGNPTFFGIIPGGDSFVINQQNNVTQVSAGFNGFYWTPNIRVGTSLFIVGNDNRGDGTGGSTSVNVANNFNNDNGCLNSSSPSSTAGNPAGGSYPTSSSGASTGSTNGSLQLYVLCSLCSSTNVGAIVGGVVGGVVGLLALLLVFYFIRRRAKHHRINEKPVDLLQADEGDEHPNHPGELPEYYRPEPFIVPDPSTDETTSQSGRLSGSERPTSRSGTPNWASTSTSRKSEAPRVLRPVNIIQHDDAGPSEGKKEEEPETIELPPAYTNIRK
ncbi:hypothetical protein BDP27DRAFT_1212621 [Rhodocollybia butyracea]|uniref:Uncharacterized protein n=1 Tax=Rhodocollybia butyracea TaxID=206335 RepID=A0A9P5Q4E4_9AGAR|nr:hypothetical protein BDP27DRAFT_1212621 [Rhodocollybia butyracea]